MTRDQTFDAIAASLGKMQADMCPVPNYDWLNWPALILACCIGFAIVRYAKYRWSA